jgi:anti-anti-sigma regulatory factor
MARIRTVNDPRLVRVVVSGQLGAADMRRLEHACALALTNEQAALVVDLERVTTMDAVAAAHIRHLTRRGAIVKRQ